MTCFFISCKYFEVKKLSINFFRGITANAYELDAIRDMELGILKLVSGALPFFLRSAFRVPFSL